MICICTDDGVLTNLKRHSHGLQSLTILLFLGRSGVTALTPRFPPTNLVGRNGIYARTRNNLGMGMTFILKSSVTTLSDAVSSNIPLESPSSHSAVAGIAAYQLITFIASMKSSGSSVVFLCSYSCSAIDPPDFGIRRNPRSTHSGPVACTRISTV